MTEHGLNIDQITRTLLTQSNMQWLFHLSQRQDIDFQAGKEDFKPMAINVQGIFLTQEIYTAFFSLFSAISPL